MRSLCLLIANQFRPLIAGLVPILMTIALCMGPSPACAQERWSLTAHDDDVNQATVRIAAVRNPQGYELKIYAPSHWQQIWATFLLPANGPAILGSGKDLRWQVSSDQTFSLAEVIATIPASTCPEDAGLFHSGPRYVAFAIADASKPFHPNDALRGLISGQQLTVYYGSRSGGQEQIQFTLTGAAKAIGEVMALFE